MLRSILFAAALVTAGLQGAAQAEDFYRGKTVRLVVPSAPGGG
jgi:tripartite-type tricarboxylate transporter receptor subunit TctC